MWLTSDKLGTTFKEAIKRGLPYPILTVVEYFSLGQGCLSWGGPYRAAGYFASIMLWAILGNVAADELDDTNGSSLRCLADDVFWGPTIDNRLGTTLEVNYDTAYGRHIIIEDSHGQRFERKRASNNGKLEEPSGLGLRILRRLSSKTSDEKESPKQGINSPEIELSAPNFPWRYPYPIEKQSVPPQRSFTHQQDVPLIRS
ncbi:hypothetical protein FQA39_LY12101 [Lamprigera yunnana]|nr:hypothetical protein FQA39_LY12101 [Lamprigera yunnana]